MKTIKEIAAKFDLYQLNDIPHDWRNYQNFDWRIELGQRDNKLPDFLTTLENYEVGLFWNCKTQDRGTEKELKYIEHSYILVKKKDSDLLLLLRTDWRSKKYSFMPYYSHIRKFHDISHYKRDEALKGLNEPNLIGVWSEKKMNDWAKYCDDYMSRLNSLLVEVQDKNKEIENKIETFIQSIDGAQVSKWDKITSVTTPHFTVRFEHFRDQNYLNTKIEFSGTLADITEIEKLFVTI